MSDSVHNRSVKAVLFNRILLALGFFGLFVAGSLSFAKLQNLTPPCVAAASCAQVTNDPTYSVVPGTHIPLAYLGFAAYFVLTALALVRGIKGLESTKPLITIGYIISAFGAISSLWLQFISFNVIHAACLWCITSAATMVAHLVFYALLAQEVDENPGTANANGGDLKLAAICAVLAIIGVGVANFYAHKSIEPGPLSKDAKDVELVPKDAHIYGAVDAPITVIEFADICCPSCQKNSPKLKEFIRNHPGKIRMVYRNFPLPKHKNGTLAAAMAEYAGGKNKFFEFLISAMGESNGENEIEDVDKLYHAATSVGLDVNDMKKHLGDDDIVGRVTRDITAGNNLGVRATPTFLLLLPKKDPVPYAPDDLFKALDDNDVRKILNGK